MDKNKYNKEEMIKRYIELCNKLGRVASKKDINECSELPSADTFICRFGSMANLHEITGVTKNNESPGKPFKAEVEKILIKKRIYRGRRLDYMEIGADPDLPTIGYIRKVYNNKLLEEIWIEIERKIPKEIADYLRINN